MFCKRAATNHKDFCGAASARYRTDQAERFRFNSGNRGGSPRH
jgi:hypothetical protein